MGGIFLKFTPMLVKHLLGLLGLSGLIVFASWTYIATLQRNNMAFSAAS